MSHVELGCGLIAIGRQWGTTPEVPTEADAMRFLESAYELGVRFFDTAPSYGLSEERLGIFLSSLTPEQRSSVVVATKFGEHWDANTQTAYADHSFEALKRSLGQSRQRLGQISILQLHKVTPELLANQDVDKALVYARELGIDLLGASVSDPVSAAMAMKDRRFDVVQLPYNRASAQFQPYVRSALTHGKELLINRPFQMGQVAAEEQASDKQAAAIGAFGFILQENFEGVVLTGTSNIKHLRENMMAFNLAQQG